MRRKSFLIELIAILISSSVLAIAPANGQERPKLSKRKQELSKIRGNIQLYQKRLAESNQRESISLATLDKLEKRNLKTRLTINRISYQIDNNSKNISSVESKISDASARLENLKEEYASFARGFYEQGRMHDLELLLTSASVNEMLVRYEYLKRFSDQTRLDLNSITIEKQKLTALRGQLGKRLAEQQNYLRHKNL